MKNTVTLEELNAGILLLAGIPINVVSEVHLSAGQVTVIYVAKDGEDVVNRVHTARIEYPQPPATEEPEEVPEVPEEGPTDNGDEPGE